MAKVLVAIHGMGRFRWSMAHFGPIAHLKGYRFLNLSYSPRDGSLQDIASTLHSKILQNCSPEDELYFVGHSLGGLIIRAIDSIAGDAPRFVRAVTLGTPHRGCELGQKLAKFSLIKKRFGAVYQDLYLHRLPDTAKHLEIGTITGVISSHFSVVPWLSGPNDGLVKTSESILSGVAPDFVVHCIHGLLMYHPAVISKVFKFLDSAKF